LCDPILRLKGTSFALITQHFGSSVSEIPRMLAFLESEVRSSFETHTISRSIAPGRCAFFHTQLSSDCANVEANIDTKKKISFSLVANNIAELYITKVPSSLCRAQKEKKARGRNIVSVEYLIK
jgi:hypothetical protein